MGDWEKIRGKTGNTGTSIMDMMNSRTSNVLFFFYCKMKKYT